MPRLYLVRHAKPLAAAADDRDPPLAPQGVEQALAMARALFTPAPLPLISSPLLRCRQTAEPLAKLWKCDTRIEPDVREVPSPGRDGAERARFLHEFIAARWGDVLSGPDGAHLARWRATLIGALQSLREETVVVSHFVPINVVVGLATGNDAVSAFKPAHASVTIVDVEDGAFRLRRLGAQAETTVTSG
jgi:broad specificity phosphatase PhoE